jgi:hypothetical protein
MIYYAFYILSYILIEALFCFQININPFHFNFQNNAPIQNDVAVIEIRPQQRLQPQPQPRPQFQPQPVVRTYGYKYDDKIIVSEDKEYVIDIEANTIGFPKEKALCIFTQEKYPNKTTITILRCDHHFRKRYLQIYLAENHTCPICRHDVTMEHPNERES